MPGPVLAGRGWRVEKRDSCRMRGELEEFERERVTALVHWLTEAY